MATRNLEIEQTYFVKASATKVFRALSDPKVLTTWFLAEARLEREKGGSYDFKWEEGYHHSGKVLDLVLNKKLSLSWPNKAGGKSVTTRVTFTLRRKGRGTLIRIRHEGYPRRDPWIEVYGGTQSGWAYYFTNLKSVLEHGYDLRSP
jgi:uncharacterized protein YndB with AHSA1/START domain